MTEIVREFEGVLERVRGAYASAFGAAASEHELREQNARLLGPAGELTLLMKRMREVPGDKKRELGQRTNAVKGEIEQAFSARLAEISRAVREAELNGPGIDPTLPGRAAPIGRLHPMTQVTYQLLDVFAGLGFDVADGPEIDLHEHNFDMLGFPPDHPATDMQDSFYLARDGASTAKGDVDKRALLRTHTSTIQVREMLKQKPPLAVVAPGAVFRRDDDATHSPMFFQIEGFIVDEGVTFAHLKGVLTRFLQALFGADVKVRFRPSYFPFVEPGGEIDIYRNGRWMEVLGCGMIHPVVLENVGYDPEKVSGFAFGMGVDRMAMLLYGIDNIKQLYENDVRLLTQF
ncbi:MAG: Phenylalanyl-tRNA synthetase alpha chain [Myxococcaceae bacterium]|nr:Phenylalanyl-tRNA synthetase alpha chain [Myxococcaceae bacterium]